MSRLGIGQRFKRARQASLCGAFALLSLVGLGVETAQAEGAASVRLPCAVAGTGSVKRARRLCEELGRELARPVVVVDDGAKVRKGDAVHIIRGDVDWLVIFLRDGRTRAYTRVSAQVAEGQEVAYLARASRALMKVQEKARVDKNCLRVEPNGQVPMRVSELAYPWVDLKKCRAHTIDVADPWWVPPAK